MKSRSIAGRLAMNGVAPGASERLVRTTMARWTSATQLRVSQITKRLRRIVALSLLPCLPFISFLMCASTASAQKAPDSVIVSVDPIAGIKVTFTACYVSTEANCVYPFSIYRGLSTTFNQAPIGYAALGNGGNSYTGTYDDQNFTKGQAYYYQVCSGKQAVSGGSNCIHTTTPVTVQPTPATPKPTVSLNGAPAAINYGQSANLSWTSANAYKLDLEPGIGKVTVPTGSMQVNPNATQTYTLIAYGQGDTGSASAYFTIHVTCPNPWAPPGNVTTVGGLSDVPLKWMNPNTSAGQTCPGPASQVLIYRMGGTAGWWQQLASLNKSNGILPTHYTDGGPLQPHTGYQYELCEGGAPDWQAPNNCASPHGVYHAGVNYGVVTWGADPVLTATRVNASTVRLRLALDQYTVTSISITRQGSDDPCRQGGTLGNGLQGCRTTTIGPNGVGVNPAHIDTLYDWNWSQGSQYPPGFPNTTSAPYVITIPDDTTVKPGVSYYYQAHVEWLWSVGQDSATVPVPNAYATVPVQQSLAGGLKSLKSNGNAPPPQSQSNGAAAPMTRAVSRTITPASSSLVRLAGSATAPPPPQSVTAATPMMAQAMTPTTPMLRPGRPTMSSTGPSAAPLLAQSATAAARPTVAAVKAAASGMIPPVRPVEVLPGAANLKAAIKQVQQTPHDAQALYALGNAYCASGLKNTGVSYMYMALLLAEQGRNAPLASQIKTSLAGQGVKVE